MRVCSVSALALLVSVVLAAPRPPVRQQEVPLGFVLIGDSTTNNGTTLNSGGWSNGFCASLADVENVYCMNEAHNGATTGSTISSGQFDHALDTIKTFVADGKKTYVTVQFGHNDMKIATPESMGANLTIMIDAIRAAGGLPILVTSLTRRSFNADGTIADTLQPWADETLLIAQQEGTLSIDLHADSIAYCEAIGPDACHRLNRSETDNTHLNENGMTVFGRMVALLVKAVLPDCLELVENDTLDYDLKNGLPAYR
ncbi:SGNH hydrolase [Auriculariales sp. MPI-PUGE-AT-0066]|nr:SGNH hydrolase [Auriculariales sp. MPI-PUGE-AT-0066]